MIDGTARWLTRLVVAVSAIAAILEPGIWLLALIFVSAVTLLGYFVVQLALSTDRHRDAWSRNHRGAR